jgi:hypothetical protein
MGAVVPRGWRPEIMGWGLGAWLKDQPTDYCLTTIKPLI